MILKKLEDLQVGETVITEYKDNILLHKIIEIEEYSVVDENYLDIYPDEETQLYVVLGDEKLYQSICSNAYGYEALPIKTH